MSEHIIWEGRKVPLLLDRGVWRMRCRTKWLAVNETLRTPDLAVAKKEAKRILERRAAEPAEPLYKGTVGDAVHVFLNTPRRAGARASATYVSRLRSICRTVLGRELSEVSLSEIGPQLWHAYQRIELGGTLDYSRRRPENRRINIAIRAAYGIFSPAMIPDYEAAGLTIPPHVRTFKPLPELELERSDADDAALVVAWRSLPDGPLWRAVGLARFAGLRRAEIMALRGSWIREAGGAVYVDVRDRPSEGFQHKTGRRYSALVTDASLAANLKGLLTGSRFVEIDPAVEWEFYRVTVLRWLRPFVGGAGKPLHRLRGLYADEVARLTADAVAARQAGIAAAQKALGHSTPATTEMHYLTETRPAAR